MQDKNKKISVNLTLAALGLLAVCAVLSPVLYLTVRDGLGNAVFPFHDQLDETILNYVFPARYFGASVYEQMMCGIPQEGLKPFCPIFVPLYSIFSVYTAFLIQHCITVVTAYVGMYLCVRKLTDNYLISFGTAFLFALLPVHSIYGNVVMGTPLLIYCILRFREKTLSDKIIAGIGLVFYALSTSFVLSEWVALSLVFLAFIIISLKNKKADWVLLCAFGILLAVYVVCNIDLIIEVFSGDTWVSHRTEFGFGASGKPFLETFVGLLTKGSYTYEAESKHEFTFIPVGVAALLLLLKRTREKFGKIFACVAGTIAVLAFFSALMDTEFVGKLQDKLQGMLSSFQLSRFYYFLPGCWFILLGVSGAIIVEAFPAKKLWVLVSYALVAVLFLPTLNRIARDKDGIFYQNINQINNGEAVTGYITMKSLYSDDLMKIIEEAIGKDMSSYRVVHIGISPVAALMHGFNTIDGYSNNYPLEYKHTFRKVIADELELNDYNKTYFDCWGSRCYAFYHEWGNAFMLGKSFGETIADLRLNFDELRKLNCQYIFSAGEIVDCDKYGLRFVGDYETDSSYWHIFVYEVENNEENSVSDRDIGNHYCATYDYLGDKQ